LDTLTHTVIGACVGEAIAGKKLGKQAMLWGAITNNLPDIDVLSYFWLKQPDTFLFHRGITHSILFSTIIIPCLAIFLAKVYKRKHFTWQEGLLLAGSGLLLHITLDALTAYGTGWFEPFSHYRVSLNTLFIVDPLFSIAFLISTIALLILKSKSLKRKAWFRFAFIFSGIYLALTLCIKIHVNNVAEREFKRQHLSPEKYFSTPTPFNNLLWYIVEKDSAGFNVGYYGLFDKGDTINFSLFPQSDSLLYRVEDQSTVQKLVRFSQGYYLVENKDPLFIFKDLRFGQIGGWYMPDAPFIFSYNLFREADNSMVIQQGRKKASSPEAIRKLIERIRGEKP
jgi:inner membrane protein